MRFYPLQKSTRAINDINNRVRLIGSEARLYYGLRDLQPYLDDLENHARNTTNLMNELTMTLDCNAIVKRYNGALIATCSTSLLGLIVMLVSAATAGLLFTVLVWCNSHTWIYFKHKGRYIKVDDTDPYMPLSTIERPRLSGGPSAAAMQAQRQMAPHAAMSAYGYAGKKKSPLVYCVLEEKSTNIFFSDKVLGAFLPAINLS